MSRWSRMIISPGLTLTSKSSRFTWGGSFVRSFVLTFVSSFFFVVFFVSSSNHSNDGIGVLLSKKNIIIFNCTILSLLR